MSTSTFNAESYTTGILSCYSLAAKAQIDDVQLRRLFPSREEAMADGIEEAKLRAEAQKAFNTDYPFLNDDLTARMNAIAGVSPLGKTEMETLLAEHLSAIRKKAEQGTIARQINTQTIWSLEIMSIGQIGIFLSVDKQSLQCCIRIT